MDDIIVFVGARGGQGTSTVAVTAAMQAAQHSPTSLLCVDRSPPPRSSVPRPFSPASRSRSPPVSRSPVSTVRAAP